jgi:hypothetical protein
VALAREAVTALDRPALARETATALARKAVTQTAFGRPVLAGSAGGRLAREHHDH